MGLRRYFDTDDGSLPEVEIAFDSPKKVARAFRFLFSCGAVDVTAYGGCKLWNVREDRDIPFSGPEDARLLLTGDVHQFHIVLGGMSRGRHTIPDLGVSVYPEGLTIDYRMGAGWGDTQIESLVLLLRELAGIGGTIAVPWWGEDGNRDFQAAVFA